MPTARYESSPSLIQQRRVDGKPVREIADIYNRAGRDYITYADGTLAQLFSFDGVHGYADSQIWRVLDKKLTLLRASGTASIRFLDAGCGPGTWLRRLVVRARELGFTRITARGFDIAQSQIHQARLLTRDIAALPGVDLTFDIADLLERLQEPPASVDITLCLYSVISHLPLVALEKVARELARVTSGYLVVAVRSVGSTPSAFVHSIEKVRYLQHDNDHGVCEIELHDGLHTSVCFHLFTASELQKYFGSYFAVEEIRGIDLFHTRFAPDPRWSPSYLHKDSRLNNELVRLEDTYASKEEFIDRAIHILLVAKESSCFF